jgi:CheY-like chemotaxis protein/anti-sigma regulatory factor (Ser/Thr protein kinase)
MLHQSEKLSALGELLAGVAHELNNPLSVVVGHSLMLEEEIDDPSLLKRTQKISSAAERCSRIVKTFLSMARQRPAKLELTAVNTIVETSLDIAGYGLRSAGCEVKLDLTPELPPVNADADQLVQVLANLIVNAEHALAEKGADARLTIVTRMSRLGREVVIEVIDNGPGIPEPVRARIFEPFFTTKTIGEGTGIGLAFCHRVIDTHDGQIDVKEARGGGAHFTIRLAKARPDSPEIAAPRQAQGKAESVLIIDDEADVAELISHIFDRDGYQVTTLNSAEAALKILPGSFDLILSDINMPGLDGKDFLSILRDRWPGLEARLGFITGDTMSPGAEHFLGQAGRPYLEKPITPADLRALAARILSENQGTGP